MVQRIYYHVRDIIWFSRNGNHLGTARRKKPERPLHKAATTCIQITSSHSPHCSFLRSSPDFTSPSLDYTRFLVCRQRVHTLLRLSVYNAANPNLQERAYKGGWRDSADRRWSSPSTNTHYALRARDNDGRLVLTTGAPARRASHTNCHGSL